MANKVNQIINRVQIKQIREGTGEIVEIRETHNTIQQFTIKDSIEKNA